MSENGWVKMHRSLLDWEWYDSPSVRQVFIHLILKANHQDTMWKGKIIKRGQVITGRKTLSQDLKISEAKIRASLKTLKLTGEITTKSTNKYTKITVCNYDKYQIPGHSYKNNQQKDQQTASKKTNKITSKKVGVNARNNYPFGGGHNTKRPAKKPAKRPTDSQPDSHKQEVKNIKNIKKTTLRPLTGSSDCPHKKIINLYHKFMISSPEVKVWNGVDLKALKARWREDRERQNLDWWEWFFTECAKSDFLTGKTNTPFIASLGWMVKASNFNKILNGNYVNRQTTGTGSTKTDRNLKVAMEWANGK